MSDLEQQFLEDRALRDAARDVLMADIAHAKATLSGKGLAERVAERIGEGAQDVFEVAKDHAEDKRGIIATLIGAILLWIAREPILEIVGLKESEDHDDASDALGEDDPAVEEPIEAKLDMAAPQMRASTDPPSGESDD